jgi:hypothetical protein
VRRDGVAEQGHQQRLGAWRLGASLLRYPCCGTGFPDHLFLLSVLPARRFSELLQMIQAGILQLRNVNDTGCLNDTKKQVDLYD